MPKQLKNRWITITRPAHQAGKLIERLESDGANIIAFPLLEIMPPKSPVLIQQQIDKLDHYEMAIFISPNAVERAFIFIDKTRLASLKIAAVGKKTALSLQQQGLSVDYFPNNLFNSEALLALEAMQQVKNKKIAIFRGEGGRDLLGNTLLQRGAKIDYINVYTRQCPADNIKLLKQHYLCHKLDIIALTSGESLAHLLRLAKGAQWLNQVPLLVGSERIKQLFLQQYQQQYTGKIWVSPDPSDESMYKSLTHLF
jgi:uroporphyrinogen-III synthase